MAAWMGAITYWSGQASLPIDQAQVVEVLQGSEHGLAHLVAFSLLGLLAYWALEGVPRAARLAVVLTAVFGATDEWHQAFTPGRHADVEDVVLDTVAAAVAIVVWRLLSATPLRAPLRIFAPLVVGTMFLVAVGLAVR
jgi:VanZ family protein